MAEAGMEMEGMTAMRLAWPKMEGTSENNDERNEEKLTYCKGGCLFGSERVVADAGVILCAMNGLLKGVTDWLEITRAMCGLVIWQTVSSNERHKTKHSPAET